MTRLPNEGTKAFAAFQEYARMGPERSLDKVALNVGKSSRQMAKWSTAWNWVARAAEYDREQDEIINKAQLKLANARAMKIAKLREEKMEKDLDLAGRMRDRIDQMFKHPIHAVERNENGVVVLIKPAGWTMDTAFRGVGTVDQFERMTLGMPTSQVEQTGPGGGPIQLAVLPMSPEHIEKRFKDLVESEVKRRIEEGTPAISAQESVQVVDVQEQNLSPIGDTERNGHQHNGNGKGHL